MQHDYRVKRTTKCICVNNVTANSLCILKQLVFKLPLCHKPPNDGKNSFALLKLLNHCKWSFVLINVLSEAHIYVLVYIVPFVYSLPFSFLSTFLATLFCRRNLSGLKENSVAKKEDQENKWKKQWNHHGSSDTFSLFLWCL